jgi:hypothetical protein
MADTVTVRVPLAIRKRGGRKVVVSPDGSVLPTAPRHLTTNADPSLLKALGRAFRWKRLLDDGVYASVSDIARAEKLDRTYVGDVLRLTLLAPQIVEAIVEGRPPDGVTLPAVMKPFEMEWERQSLDPQSGHLLTGPSRVVVGWRTQLCRASPSAKIEWPRSELSRKMVRPSEMLFGINRV